MRKTLVAFGLVLLVFTIVGLVFASTVADVAKKEKQRREKIKEPVKVFTNQDIADFKAKNKDQDTIDSGEPQTQEGEATEDTSAITTPSDDKSNDEAYWRGRFQDATARVQAAQQKVDQLQRDISTLNLNVSNYEGINAGPQLQAQIGQMKNDLEVAKKELEDAKQGIEDLQDEARKAGALPGWVRE